MRANYEIGFGQTRFHLYAEVENHLEAMKFLGQCQDSLGQNSCGHCSSQLLHFRVRTAQGYQFPEVMCLECKHVLSFGQRKDDGALFPKRKTQDGEWMDHGGWVKQEWGEGKSQQTAQPEPEKATTPIGEDDLPF